MRCCVKIYLVTSEYGTIIHAVPVSSVMLSVFEKQTANVIE